jgi:hypothetical protein
LLEFLKASTLQDPDVQCLNYCSEHIFQGEIYAIARGLYPNLTVLRESFVPGRSSEYRVDIAIKQGQSLKLFLELACDLRQQNDYKKKLEQVEHYRSKKPDAVVLLNLVPTRKGAGKLFAGGSSNKGVTVITAEYDVGERSAKVWVNGKPKDKVPFALH